MITFAAGVLNDGPVRIPILAQSATVIALAKPAGVSTTGDALEAGMPSLAFALRSAVAAGRGRLRALGLEEFHALHHLDAEVSGIVLFALSATAAADLRNRMGSGRCEFIYDVLTHDRNATHHRAEECDLPLVRNAHQPCMRVSHARGKKCGTVFVPRHQSGRFTLWEARTRENRPHQVRIHAAECGLRIPGENRYDHVPLVLLSAIRPRYRPARGGERPLHGALGVHLREIALGGSDGDGTRFCAPRPRSFSVLLQRLGLTGAATASPGAGDVGASTEISLSPPGEGTPNPRHLSHG